MCIAPDIAKLWGGPSPGPAEILDLAELQEILTGLGAVLGVQVDGEGAAGTVGRGRVGILLHDEHMFLVEKARETQACMGSRGGGVWDDPRRRGCKPAKQYFTKKKKLGK